MTYSATHVHSQGLTFKGLDKATENVQQLVDIHQILCLQPRPARKHMYTRSWSHIPKPFQSRSHATPVSLQVLGELGMSLGHLCRERRANVTIGPISNNPCNFKYDVGLDMLLMWIAMPIRGLR